MIEKAKVFPYKKGSCFWIVNYLGINCKIRGFVEAMSHAHSLVKRTARCGKNKHLNGKSKDGYIHPPMSRKMAIAYDNKIIKAQYGTTNFKL